MQTIQLFWFQFMHILRTLASLTQSVGASLLFHFAHSNLTSWHWFTLCQWNIAIRFFTWFNVMVSSIQSSFTSPTSFLSIHPVDLHVPCGRTFRSNYAALSKSSRDAQTQFGLCLSNWGLTRCDVRQITLILFVSTHLLWQTTSPTCTLYLEYLQLEAN